jgi:hypothetical protein
MHPDLASSLKTGGFLFGRSPSGQFAGNSGEPPMPVVRSSDGSPRIVLERVAQASSLHRQDARSTAISTSESL